MPPLVVGSQDCSEGRVWILSRQNTGNVPTTPCAEMTYPGQVTAAGATVQLCALAMDSEEPPLIHLPTPQMAPYACNPTSAEKSPSISRLLLPCQLG